MSRKLVLGGQKRDKDFSKLKRHEEDEDSLSNIPGSNFNEPGKLSGDPVRDVSAVVGQASVGRILESWAAGSTEGSYDQGGSIGREHQLQDYSSQRGDHRAERVHSGQHPHSPGPIEIEPERAGGRLRELQRPQRLGLHQIQVPHVGQGAEGAKRELRGNSVCHRSTDKQIRERAEGGGEPFRETENVRPLLDEDPSGENEGHLH